MASGGRESGSHEDGDGVTPTFEENSTFEQGYQEGVRRTQKRMKGQIDFLLRERDKFVEDIRGLEEEIRHLRRAGADSHTGTIAP